MPDYLISSRNFGLRPCIAAHYENVTSWLSVDEFELFMTSSSLKIPVTPEQFENYRKNSGAEEGTHKFLEIIHLASEKHVGHFEIKAIHSHFRNGTLAHVLLGDREFRNKGYGRELCGLMADYGFQCLQLYRLSASVHTCNTKAVAVYIKAGFVIEGLIRDVLEFRNKRYSLYQMSLLRPEWEALQVEGNR